MQKKLKKKVFVFEIGWIGWIKLSLLRGEKLSSAVNVLINSLKTLHVTKSDFFQLNCLNSY